MTSRLSVCILSLYSSVLLCTSFAIVRWVENRRLAHSSYPLISQFGLALVFAIPLVFAQRGFQRLLLPVATSVIIKKDKWSQLLYVSKLSRFGSAVFKFIFFAVFSYSSWVYALAEASWVPAEIFGTGSTTNCWGKGNAGDTQQPVGAAITWFYLVAIAYHMSELAFQIVYERQKPDFVEMFAHHITTCFLLFASFFGNFVRIGTLVLFVHYVSDIPVYGAKIFVDTSFKVTTFLNLLGMLTSWGYLRLYVFPAIIIRSSLMESFLEREVMGDLGDYAYYVFNVGLCLLFCLHIYWYSIFIRMGWHYIFKGETKDLQANLSFMDAKAAQKVTKTA